VKIIPTRNALGNRIGQHENDKKYHFESQALLLTMAAFLGKTHSQGRFPYLPAKRSRACGICTTSAAAALTG